MHMSIELLRDLFIAYVVGSIVLGFLVLRYRYQRGIQKGWDMKEQAINEQAAREQAINEIAQMSQDLGLYD